MGYVVVALIRARDTKREIQMNFDIKRTIQALIVLSVQCYITITLNNIEIAISGCISILALMFLYRKEIIEILNQCLNLIHRKKRTIR